MQTIGHWIGGKSVTGASGRAGPVYDPARGIVAAEVALATAAEVDDAVKIAAGVADAWGAAPLSRRVAMLFSLRELIDGHREQLAECVTREHGKTLADARGEVDRGLECVEFACGVPHLLKGAHTSEVSAGIDVHTVLQPVGDFPLEYVANSASDILKDPKSGTWYLHLADRWMESKALEGPWKPLAGALPVVLSQLPKDNVRGHLRYLSLHGRDGEAERARRLLRASLVLRGRLHRGERGRLYRDVAAWLGSGDIDELLAG